MKLSAAAIYVLSVFASLPLFISSSADAISQNVVIYQVQTGGALTGTASQEIITIYNYSEIAVNVTGWCIEYSAATNGNTWTKLSCIDDNQINTEIWLESSGLVSFATNEFVGVNTGFAPDYSFSAGLAGAGGHIRLINKAKTEVDRLGWGGAVAPEGVAASMQAAGKVISRNIANNTVDSDINFVDFSSQLLISPITSGLYDVELAVDVCPNIEGIQLDYPTGVLLDAEGNCRTDICPNLEDLQINLPSGYEKLSGYNDCTEIELESAVLFITELLPNATSTDAGKEFIELYNPNDRAVNLAGYSLQVGPTYTKKFTLTSGSVGPKQYIVFYDTESKIVLPNTTGVGLRLVAPAGGVVSESEVYSNAGDDISWAFIEDQWIYTNQVTPGAANLPYLEPAQSEVFGVTSVLAPCPVGKYRNPETNRCRNIETAVSALQPCDEDEFRNPDTNRCNKTSSIKSSLTACKVGQERNPETNRCRKIVVAGSLAPCPEGQERNPDTNRCRKVSNLNSLSDGVPAITDVVVENSGGAINWFVILLALSGALVYILYEWRNELRQSYGRLRSNLVQ